ncbi:nitrous oxide-stimulated promoter family protein [Orbaceae bacterium ESL0727]|nr:nitrous oxide-stimulated promoter family protein [Orbaceae bacterium ESL0727]
MMMNNGSKIQHEQETVRLMIYLYCQKNHHKTRAPKTAAEEDDQIATNALCDECAELLDYAMRRLSLCRFGEQKTTCQRCPKHCYRTDYKVRIKQVMRFSGPRMILYHPVKALRHLYKNLIRTPS